MRIDQNLARHFPVFFRRRNAVRKQRVCLQQGLNDGSKRQIQTLEQIIKLRERFPTEVAELQKIVLVVLNT